MWAWLWAACAAPDGEWILVGEDPPDLPLAGLSDEWLDRFDAGDAAFEALLRDGQGLGPAYIRASCASCHRDDGRGPGSARKMVVRDPSGAPMPDALPYGPTERPYVAGGATTPILPPDVPGLELHVREAPAVFGRGWLEAIDEAAIVALEAEQAAGGRVSGRVNRVCWDFDAPSDDGLLGADPGDCGLVGRFGAKARVPSILGFVADAYQGDMAITTPWRAAELPNPDGLDDDASPGVDLAAITVSAVADYVRLLRIPRRVAPDPDGMSRFVALGCAGCHVPSLPTRADHPVEALRDTDAVVFTDLLLHDLGPAHDDGQVEGDAGPSEWRTAPLIGLRFLPRYLHDGRAPTLRDAVVGHGGEGSEAAPSVDAFVALPAAEQDALIDFLSTL